VTQRSSEPSEPADSGSSASGFKLTVFGKRAVLPPFLRWTGAASLSPTTRFAAVLTIEAVLVTISAAMRGAITGKFSAVRDLREALHITRQPNPVATFPLLRDYATLGHLLMIAVLVAVLPEAWRALEQIFPSMTDCGSLVIEDSKREQLAADGARHELHLASPERAIVTLALAIGMGSVGMAGYDRFGIYTVLAGRRGVVSPTVWSHMAFRHWWAEPFSAGFFVWLLFAILGNYLILWNARVVWAFGVLYYRHRRDFTLRFDRTNRDGFYGWAVVREVVQRYLWVMAVFAAGMLGLAIIAAPPAYPYLIAFLVLFVFGCLCVWWPLAAFHHMAIMEWDSVYEERKADVIALTKDDASGLGRILAPLVGQSVQDIPRSLVSVRRAVTQLFLIVVPACVAIYSMLAAILRSHQ